MVACNGAVGSNGQSSTNNSRELPPARATLTLDDGKTFSSSSPAHYVVREPSGESVDKPQLEFFLTSNDASWISGTLPEPKLEGDIVTEYELLDARNSSAGGQLDAKIGGTEYMSSGGSVAVSFRPDRHVVAGLMVQFAPVEGGDTIALSGTLTAAWTLDCFRLADQTNGSTSGTPIDGSTAVWESDPELDSSFCAAMFAQTNTL